MGQAGYLHNPWIAGKLEKLNKLAGQRKMSQVIGAELHFETIPCSLQWRRHQASVVEQHIQLCKALLYRLGKRLYRGKISQIQRHNHQPGVSHHGFHRLRGRFGLVHITAGHDHFGPFAGEQFHRFQADAAVGAGYQNRLAGEVCHHLRPPG
jgi:hypothetical protein